MAIYGYLSEDVVVQNGKNFPVLENISSSEPMLPIFELPSTFSGDADGLGMSVHLGTSTLSFFMVSVECDLGGLGLGVHLGI